MYTKKQFFLLAMTLFSGVVCRSQEINYPGALNENEQYLTDPSAYLSELDEQNITTGILIDRCLYTDQVLNLNGESRVQSINYDDWRKVYQALKWSSSDSSQLPSLSILESISSSQHKLENITILGGFNLHYNRIKKEAVNNQDLLQLPDKLSDENADSSVYFVDRAFGITGFAENIQGATINFLLAEELFFTNNANENIQSIELDFGNGSGFQPVLMNEIYPVNYSGAGRYIEIKARLTVKNTITSEEKELHAHLTIYRKNLDHITAALAKSKLGVAQEDPTGNSIYREYFPTDEPIKIKNNSGVNFELIANPQNTIEATFVMNPKNTSGKLRRPLIIVDGFDYQNKRDFYSTKKQSGLHFDNDFRGLFELLNGDPSKWDEGQSDNSSQSANLVSSLQDYGFDLVFVNWMNGAGNVYTNAQLLRDFLNKRINSSKYRDSKTEEIVLFGPSMGGVITRIALKKMEDADEEHCVKSWVSFDAPQNGANIPMTLQQSIVIGADLKPDESNIVGKKALLDSEAASQLLLDHYSEEFSFGGKVTYTNKQEHSNLYAELQSLEIPQLSSNYAITNGGKGKLYNIGSKVLGFYLKYLLKFEGWDINNYGVDGTSLMFRSDVLFNKSASKSKNVYGKISYSSAPGGWHSGMYSLNFDLENADRDRHSIENIHTKWACFIPTASAFGMLGTTKDEHATNINRTWNEYTNFNDVTSGKIRTPFDGVYGMEENEEHMKITISTKNKLMDDWIKPNLTTTKVPKERHQTQIDKHISKPVAFVLQESVEFASGVNTVTVKPEATVKVVAGKSIKFSKGFSVKNGALLNARIEEKDYNTLRKKPASAGLIVHSNNSTAPSEYKNVIHDYSAGSNEESEISAIVEASHISDFSIQLYPNPVQNRLTINVVKDQSNDEEIGEMTFTLMSLYGQEIQTIKSTDLQQQFNCSSLNAGVYVLKVSAGNQNQTIRFVKD